MAFVALFVIAVVWRTELVDMVASFPARFGTFAYLAMGTAIAAAVVFALPMVPFYALCGASLGLGPGLATALLGAASGSVVSFCLARVWRGPTPTFIRPSWRRAIARRGTLMLVLLRLSPIIPLASVNIGAGLLGVRLRTFLLTLPASAPSGSMVVVAGAFGASLIQGRWRPEHTGAAVLFGVSTLGLLASARILRKELREHQDVPGEP